jgi:signal peptidase I
MKARRVLLIPLVGCLGLFCILCGCGLGVVLRALPVFKMQGHSMEPALQSGDLLFVNPWAYRRHLPARGDVIVLRYSDEGWLLPKRVIGLPGERVDIADGKIFIDGLELVESYVDQSARAGQVASVSLSERQVYVLGDNRNHSSDSRNFGPVSLGDIVGKVVVVQSPERMRLMPEMSYPTPGIVP